MNYRNARWAARAIVAVAVLGFANPAQPRADAKQLTPAAKASHDVKRYGGTAVPPQVRMSWESFISGPAGAKRLASLNKAITKMKSLNSAPKTSADYRRSWEYWANIHGYYGPKSPSGPVARQIQRLQNIGDPAGVAYYDGTTGPAIVDQLPPDAIATLIWATCQHSRGTQANFFGWHRMYLYYFEQVLRWAAQDNTLRLPYWDYTNPAQVAVPAQFRDTTSEFYDVKRDASMNSGASTLDPASTNVDTSLSNADYLSYELDIEGNIHGYVHCTVAPSSGCPVAHMGDVPVAGNDPVFYHHHANIDRLWSCWQHLHTQSTTGPWYTQKFTFVDATGTQVTKPVSDFVFESKLGYVYDNESNCRRPGATPLKNRAARPLADVQVKTLGSKKGVAITSPQTAVDIPVPKPNLTNALADLNTAQTTQLVLRDVAADAPPGALFNVYVAKKSNPTVRQRVGTISWFAVFGTHHGDSAPVHRTLTYDATAALRALGGSSLVSSGVTVIFEATSGRVPSGQAKADVRAAATEFRAASNVRIGEVDLRAAPAGR